MRIIDDVAVLATAAVITESMLHRENLHTHNDLETVIDVSKKAVNVYKIDKIENTRSYLLK